MDIRFPSAVVSVKSEKRNDSLEAIHDLLIIYCQEARLTYTSIVSRVSSMEHANRVAREEYFKDDNIGIGFSYTDPYSITDIEQAKKRLEIAQEAYLKVKAMYDAYKEFVFNSILPH